MRSLPGSAHHRIGQVRRARPLLAVAAAALVLAPAAGARADEFPVTNLEDSGDGSLRDALEQANANDGEDDVVLSLDDDLLPGGSDPAQIDLESAPPPLVQSVVVDGSQAGLEVEVPAGETTLEVQNGDTRLIDTVFGGGDGISVAADARLVYEVGEDASVTVGTGTSGDGELVKSGAGVLVLSAPNTYTGGTTVEVGTLRGNTDGLQGAIEVSEAAVLEFELTGSGVSSFAGAISGDGELVKSGTGTLVLSGSAVHTGGTRVGGGVLQASPQALDGDVQIQDGATLSFVLAGAGIQAYDDEIRGEGTLEKRGTGVLLLQGSNSFDGTHVIRLGGLRGTTDSIGGSVLFVPDDFLSVPVLTLDQDGSGTLSGSISGVGILVKEGSGTVTLSGQNSYQGGTFVFGGALRGNGGSLQGGFTLANGTSLVFDQQQDGALDASFASGDGLVRKLGPAALRIDSNVSTAPPARVEAGTFQLDASGVWGSDVEVQSGGVLAGTGRVAGDVQAAGGVAPTGLGSLQVGSATFTPGSSLTVAIDASGASGLLDVAGALDIQGGTLFVVPEASNFSAQRFTVATAASVSGSFDSVQDDLVFLDVSLVAPGAGDPGTVQIDVSPMLAALQGFGRTANQRAIGRALDDAIADPSQDFSDNVVPELFTLTEEEAPRLLEGLAPDELAAHDEVRLALADAFHRRIAGRFERALPLPEWAPKRGPDPGQPVWGREGASLRPLGGLPPVAAPGETLEEAPPLAGWLDTLAVFGERSGDDVSRIDFHVVGPLVGFDAALPAGLRAGVALGYAKSRVDSSRGSFDGEGDHLQAGVYLGGMWRHGSSVLSARYARNEIDNKRPARVQSLRRNAHSDYEAGDVSVHWQGALHVPWGEQMALEPEASVLWDWLRRPGIGEARADSLGYSTESEDFHSLRSLLGLRWTTVQELEDGVLWRPSLRVGWEREWGETDREVNGVLAGALSGGTFRVEGAEPPRDRARIGIRSQASVGSQVRLDLSYDVLVGEDLVDHGLSVGFRYAF